MSNAAVQCDAVRCRKCDAVGIFPTGLAGGPALCEHPAADYEFLPTKLPAAVGLCPDPWHTDDFYVPDPGKGERCPLCEHLLVRFTREAIV